MLYIETDICTFDKIETSMSIVYPSAKIEHIFTDTSLKSLGFTDNPPCVFSLDMSWDEYNDMMDELSQLETDAFNTSEGSDSYPSNESYTLYTEHGWLWDMFCNAYYNDKIIEK